MLHAGNLMMAIVAERAGDPQPGLGAFSGEFTAQAGRDVLLTLIVADHAPLVVPSAADVRRRREASEQGSASRRSVQGCGAAPNRAAP